MTDVLQPFVGEEAVRRGMQAICVRFRALDSEGPTWVARFLGGGDPESETRIRRDAFMTVGEVCRLLGISGS